MPRAPHGDSPDFVKKYVNFGASVRAAQFLVLAGKARALMHGRYHVSYEDVRALALPIMRHRILLNFHAESERVDQAEILRRLLDWKTPRGIRKMGFSPRVQATMPAAIDNAISIPKFSPRSQSLDLVAKTVVDGFVAGLHRSPDFVSARSSPNIAPIRPATISGTWIGTCLRGPSGPF